MKTKMLLLSTGLFFLQSCNSNPPQENIDKWIRGVYGEEREEIGDFLRALRGRDDMRENVILIDQNQDKYFVNDIALRTGTQPDEMQAYVDMLPPTEIAAVQPNGPIVVDKRCSHRSGLFYRLKAKPGASGALATFDLPSTTYDSNSDTATSLMKKYKDGAFLYFGATGTKGSEVDAGLMHLKTGWAPFMAMNRMQNKADDTDGWYVGPGIVRYENTSSVKVHFEIINFNRVKLEKNKFAWYLVMFTEGMTKMGWKRQTIAYKTYSDSYNNMSNPTKQFTDFDLTKGSVSIKLMATLGQDIETLAQDNFKLYPTGSYFTTASIRNLVLMYNYRDGTYIPDWQAWNTSRDLLNCAFPLNGGMIVSNRTGDSLDVSIQAR